MLFAVLFSVTDRRAVFLLLGPARDAPLHQARVLQGSDDGDDGEVRRHRQDLRGVFSQVFCKRKIITFSKTN